MSEQSTMPDLEELVTRLRAWTQGHDPHVRAAVNLLIWHEYWLRRRDFVRAAVIAAPREAWIRWDAARDFAEAGPRSSTSELAVLNFAIALGSDQYRFNHMGHAHAEAIVTAVREAFGLGRARA